MPYVTPILSEAPNTDNTGEYSGYQIRVKGDGRVQAVSPEGNTTMHRNVINAKTWVDQAVSEGGGGETETVTLTGIDPTSVAVDTAIQITLTGTGFTEASTVQVDGNGVVSAYVSETSMTADLPSFATPGDLSVTVTTDGTVSEPMTFSITAAE